MLIGIFLLITRAIPCNVKEKEILVCSFSSSYKLDDDKRRVKDLTGFLCDLFLLWFAP